MTDPRVRVVAGILDGAPAFIGEPGGVAKNILAALDSMPVEVTDEMAVAGCETLVELHRTEEMDEVIIPGVDIARAVYRAMEAERRKG